MKRTGLGIDESFERHDTGPDHPESIERYRVLRKQLARLCRRDGIERMGADREATPAELMRCHDHHYIDLVRIDADHFAETLRTGDTAICDESFEVACIAAGTCLEMVDRVMRGELRNGFCAVRPPGHHATRNQGMGFCIFNNAALAARHAQECHGLERVLIVDWDVHHGNGTQDIFYDDPSVFFFSVHEWPSYPYAGAVAEEGVGPGEGATMNCPLDAGADGETVLAALKDRLVPAMADFRPEFIVISAGFDALAEASMSSFQLTPGDFASLTRLVMDLADDTASGRVVSILEGGYDPVSLTAAAEAHVRTLAGGA